MFRSHNVQNMKLFIKALPYAIAVAVVFFIGSMIYSAIYSAGQKDIQAKWDQAKIEYQVVIDNKKTEYDTLEENARRKTDALTLELSNAKTKHAVAIVDIRAEHDKRLRQSEIRAGVYQRQAEGGAAECTRLAGHAARLDSTIEDGRRVVRELRETLGLRDSQLIELGNQIKADRILLDAPQ